MKVKVTTNKGTITSGATSAKVAAKIAAAALRRGKKFAIIPALLLVTLAARCQDYAFTVQSVAVSEGATLTKPAPVTEREYLFKREVGPIYALYVDGEQKNYFRLTAALPDKVKMFTLSDGGAVLSFTIYRDEVNGEVYFLTAEKSTEPLKTLYLYKD
jgi:hypothetical protein